MKKFKWLLGMLVLALMPMLQSCDDDDGYSIGDFSWDWATVRTTGGGGYYLVGDRWGIIDPVATSIPWFKPVDGERVVSFFNPLADMSDEKGVQVKMEGIQEVLTKEVEEMTAENRIISKFFFIFSSVPGCASRPPPRTATAPLAGRPSCSPPSPLRPPAVSGWTAWTGTPAAPPPAIPSPRARAAGWPRSTAPCSSWSLS